MAADASGKIVVAVLPMPQGLSADDCAHPFRRRRILAALPLAQAHSHHFVLMLLLVTVFVFFSSVWLAVFLSKQITRPVEALADAMDEIAAGKYEQRVRTVTTGEMADLVRSFNHMAADLETSRQLAESSSAQLTAANQAIEERRRELETIVETIPSGVVTLDGAGMVLQANRAFAALMGLRQDAPSGRREASNRLLPAECADDLASGDSPRPVAWARLPLRSNCTPAAAPCISPSPARASISPAAKPGTVLVVEDTTELLRAQRQLAWKEVAQRVAHEIKNPLTPIASRAERIGRHLDRGQPDSPSIIRKCSEVILGCVGTLRTLVDQFSALAQFPAPQPRALRHEPGRRRSAWLCLPAASKASPCSATSSRICRRCWPIPRPSAALSPT